MLKIAGKTWEFCSDGVMFLPEQEDFPKEGWKLEDE